jgi:hypothetical protein
VIQQSEHPSTSSQVWFGLVLLAHGCQESAQSGFEKWVLDDPDWSGRGIRRRIRRLGNEVVPVLSLRQYVEFESGKVHEGVDEACKELLIT